ncbi:MAG: SurA N-terminal domain-containing protein [Phycisphaerales bacterium]|nr:SurA N-terminal domain-containing protein [Phycisphaerales bacterium]
MLRVLRKYNRLLLAIFGSGIMIVFLLGNADVVGYFSGLGGQSSWVAKFADGRTISRQDFSRVQQELMVLDRLRGIGLLQPLPVVGDITRDPDAYITLLHEAAEAGMVTGPGAVQLDTESLIQLSNATGYSPVVVKQAIAGYDGISRYVRHILEAGVLSDRRQTREGRRQFESADTKLAVVRAKAEDASTPPTEEQLQAQFDAWKDIPAGEGDHGFGYRLPDRVRAEWIIVPQAAVEAGVRSGIETDDTDLRMYWRRNSGDGGRFPAIGDELEVPNVVVEAWVKEEVQRRQRDLERRAADLLRAPRRGLDSVDGIVALPDDWASQRLPLDSLRQQLTEEFDMPADAIAQVETTGDELTPVEDVADLEAFRFASTDRFGPTPEGRPRWSVEDLLTGLNEFGESGVPLQSGVAMPVLTAPTGDRLFIRVTEAEADRPPHDLAEVRDQVDSDVRRLSRYEQLVARQGELRGLADAGGLDAVVDTWELDAPLTTSIRRSTTGTIGGLGADPDVAEAIIDRSIELGADPLSDIDESDRIIITPSDRHLALVIARLDRRVPANESLWDAIVGSGQLVQLTAVDDFGGPGMPDLAEALSVEALSARHGYVRSGNSDEEDEESSSAPAQDTTDETTTSADAS